MFLEGSGNCDTVRDVRLRRWIQQVSATPSKKSSAPGWCLGSKGNEQDSLSRRGPTIWRRWKAGQSESLRVCHETIYRSLVIQARGVLKRELMEHLRSKRRMRRSHPSLSVKGSPRNRGQSDSRTYEIARRLFLRKKR